MNYTRKIVVSALMTIGAAALVLTQTAGTRQSKAFKLEGAWLARVPESPLQWTYSMIPDPSGRRATLFGNLDVGVNVNGMIPGFLPDYDDNTPFAGELVMTGPDTAVFSALGHSISDTPYRHVVYSWVTSGEAKFTASGKLEVTHHIAYYLPDADADGDGIPDPGATPVLCLPPTVSIDTRIGLMPPCSP